ncbi:MAG: bi-domain-containing oxidoreductase [Proteobacteria bacterium]|nr:bi-domain-containing oxidoreductase [Pseudomonadota bacterium]
MKQVLQNLKTGRISVEEVPRPLVRPGRVLVRNQYSVISTGTEGGTVKLGQMSLLGKARARPEQVRKVINVVRTEGLLTAYQAATRTLSMPIPMGYSCAGRVVEAGEGVGAFKPGDLVACGGGGMAVHAEYVLVPKNLCVRIPPDVDLRLAAFTTLGAIALQSLRVARVGLGDKVVVIGLGLVGLLTADLLAAAGCLTLGIDTDPGRVGLAEERGMGPALTRGVDNLKERVLAFSEGRGADAVIITASSDNNDPVALAGELARHKGRVVVVGRTEINAPRDTYLFKELELCTSLAYGPGTGDPAYEEKGLDYPAAYVRWTENRNMAAFLDQLSQGRLRTGSFITHELPLVEAARAYDVITGQSREPHIAVLLSYPETAASESGRVALKAPAASPRPTSGTVRIGVLGAGGFATNFMIPTLSGLKGVELAGIASATGVRAGALGRKYGFSYCASSPMEVIEDPDLDAVFILTRHDTHAAYAVEALRRGRHVFVEKPLAMTLSELDSVVDARRETGLQAMVGFNRPFAALSGRLREFVAGRAQPMAIHYLANVGYRPPEAWIHDPVQGGGVIVGEACHFIDYCLWLTGSEPVEVQAWAMAGDASGLIPEDNVQVHLRFADGSLATVAYLSCGDPSPGRERIEVLAEGGLAVLVDFRDLVLNREGKKKRHRLRVIPDKGYAAEVETFIRAIRGEDASSGLFDRQVLSMRTTLLAVESMRQGRPMRVAHDIASSGAGKRTP